MLSIILRTLIIYIIITVIMRLMGKRQLGELDVSELVITILLSEIAAIPITNPEKSIFDSLVAIVTLAILEIVSSIAILKLPIAKSVLSSKPATLIRRGTIDFKAMKKVRISLEELISQVRQSGIYDLGEVDYAILEENGKMSVIPKNANRQPDKHDLNVACESTGVMHIVISDGNISGYGLELIGRNAQWIKERIQDLGLKLNDIFCMTVDDAENYFIQKRDGTQIKGG